MPWRQVPKKDVEHCDKPRGAVCRRYIRGCPNGETRRRDASLQRRLPTESIGRETGTRGTETSQYPEEKRPFR